MIDLMFLILIALGLGYVAFAWRSTPRIGESEYPRAANDHGPVTILKPLKGWDDCLEDNLRTFFELDYPHFELIFGVNENDDPAIELVQRLQKEYSHISSRLVIDNRRSTLNPKIANLVNMYRCARYGLVLISDSNVRVGPRYLDSLTDGLAQAGVGMVTSPIRGHGASSLGSRLENLHLNGYIAGSIHAVRRLAGVQLTIGKSMLLRREHLEEIGGLAAFGHYLAEDYEMGRRIRELGFDTVIVSQPVDTINRDWQVAGFISRHLRWAQMRRWTNLLHYVAEPVSNPVLISLVYWLVQMDRWAFAIMLGTWTAKTSLDWLISRRLGSRQASTDYLLMPMKDLLLALVWVVPFFHNTVNWRGNQLRIMAGTQLELPDEGLLPGLESD